MSYPSKKIVRVWWKLVDVGKGYSVVLEEIDCLNNKSQMFSFVK